MSKAIDFDDIRVGDKVRLTVDLGEYMRAVYEFQVGEKTSDSVANVYNGNETFTFYKHRFNGEDYSWELLDRSKPKPVVLKGNNGIISRQLEVSSRKDGKVVLLLGGQIYDSPVSGEFDLAELKAALEAVS